jgi:hypothetical protein
MTTATETSTRVPVRTWQEKAILCSAIAARLTGLHEAHDWLGSSEVRTELVDEAATDRRIDAYMDSVAPIVAIEQALAALRATTPGPDASIEVPAIMSDTSYSTDEPPGQFGLLENLNEVIEYLVECDVEKFLPHVDHPPQRAIAEATVVAIDLRDELAGGAA